MEGDERGQMVTEENEATRMKIKSIKKIGESERRGEEVGRKKGECVLDENN